LPYRTRMRVHLWIITIYYYFIANSIIVKSVHERIDCYVLAYVQYGTAADAGEGS